MRWGFPEVGISWRCDWLAGQARPTALTVRTVLVRQTPGRRVDDKPTQSAFEIHIHSIDISSTSPLISWYTYNYGVAVVSRADMHRTCNATAGPPSPVDLDSDLI
ncbi:uncharacterized protein DFL_001144 [Arthrobotrys flagrans]|uniref:Uncharacterized protein n=1 Tax=Arthrobotrys flagrans TaxID=97331 RepID=A0A437AGC1_ARTFL|nr:hypothetical protein DFL_001144 [Arthrobotrys flagrans]